MVILGAYLVGLGPWGGPLGSHLADLGCQDNDNQVLDAILLQDDLKLTTLSKDKGKYAYLGCISG